MFATINYMEKDLLVLSGKMTSGKSTVANELNEKYGYKKLSISAPIRLFATTLIESKEEFEQLLKKYLVQEKEEVVAELKKKYVDGYKEKFEKAVWEKNEDGEYNKNQSFRTLMQFVATTLREKYSDDIWTRITAKMALDLTENDEKIVIDDLRLKEEKKILEKVGFVTIRLEISKEEQMKRIMQLYGEIDEEAMNHKTEVDLDGEYFDFRINADEPIEKVRESLKKILG